MEKKNENIKEVIVTAGEEVKEEVKETTTEKKDRKTEVKEAFKKYGKIVATTAAVGVGLVIAYKLGKASNVKVSYVDMTDPIDDTVTYIFNETQDVVQDVIEDQVV